MSDDRVLVERRGHLLLIGLNRPDKRNAADLAMLHELARAYAVLHTDPELRVGVVHAVGDHFTGGLDLADVGPGLVSGQLDLVPSGGIDPWGLVTEPVAKPVVLAAQGTCLTLGVELALAADVVVAADSTRFAQLEVARGIMAFGGATIRLPRLGWGDAMRWLLTGDFFDAAEALRIGLIHEVVPAGELAATGEKMVTTLLGCGPNALREVKSFIRRIAHGAIDDQMIEETATRIARIRATPEGKEGVSSFLEKRKPNWIAG